MELPEELLQEIFSNLQVSGTPGLHLAEDSLRRRTLTAVCLTSKQCCRLAQPILYHTIRVGGYDGSTRRVWEGVMQRPELASFVKSMYIDCWEFPRIESEASERQRIFERAQYETKVSDAIQEATKDAMLPLSTTFGADYEEVESFQLAGIDDGMLAFLVAICKNLQCLEIVAPHLFEDCSYVFSTLENMATLAVPGTQGLPKLSELSIQHWDTENAFEASIATRLWAFPSLQIFRGHMLCWQDQVPPAALWRSNIREAHLTYSLIEASRIYTLLSYCPMLEALSIEWGDATVGDDCIIEYQHIGQVLRDLPNVSRNLKKLVLNHNNSDYFEYSDEAFHAPMGSLKVLESLEHLAVGAIALIGEDDEEGDNYPNFEPQPLENLLPDSLCTLDIFSGSTRPILPGQWEPHIGQENWSDFDQKLYALMRDPRHSKLSTITMYRRIVEQGTRPKDVGWKIIELDSRKCVLERDTQDNADG